MEKKSEISHDCPVAEAFQIIGGKWKPMIIYYLKDGTKRFGELRRLIPNASQKMLTSQLRALERDGLIHREIFRQIPPRVDYSLTKLGKTLQPIYKKLDLWLETREEEVIRARTAFDQRT
ncbi:MAG: helix-turn-helix transcriptional regulator [Opitutaceae bacterium]|jgi:DNA-binding HxlR family transcriptional regulator|nr:helix-turn-helix transcriptional regulator [Opitutaceae bacterium]